MFGTEEQRHRDLSASSFISMPLTSKKNFKTRNNGIKFQTRWSAVNTGSYPATLILLSSNKSPHHKPLTACLLISCSQALLRFFPDFFQNLYDDLFLFTHIRFKFPLHCTKELQKESTGSNRNCTMEIQMEKFYVAIISSKILFSNSAHWA